MSATADNSLRPNARVFLCHNSQDKPMVRRLGKLLASNGIESWIDECELGAGCDWQEEILKGLVHAPTVIVCFGPHGTGRWQKQEIEITVQKRIEAGKSVIPLILPSCGDSHPEIPLWLSTKQSLDLRGDGTDVDPFGRLLKSIDGRDADGHYRPSVLVLLNESEPTSRDPWQRVISEGSNTLCRVRVINDSELLLETRLKESLGSTDVLVSLLSPDSYRPIPGGLFHNGIAAGAKQLANDLGVPIVQWRSDSMRLPDDTTLAVRFRTTDTETCLPSELAKHVLNKAEERFTRRRIETETKRKVVGKRQVVVGYPVKAKDGKRFVRQVAEDLERNDIECSSPPKWDFVLGLLQHDPPLYEAIVVVLTGDDDWLCDCTDGLRRLQTLRPRGLPRVRAFLHKVNDPDEADPIPIRLADFEEFYGLPDVPKLAKKITSSGGGE